MVIAVVVGVVIEGKIGKDSVLMLRVVVVEDEVDELHEVEETKWVVLEVLVLFEVKPVLMVVLVVVAENLVVTKNLAVAKYEVVAESQWRVECMVLFALMDDFFLQVFDSCLIL